MSGEKTVALLDPTCTTTCIPRLTKNAVQSVKHGKAAIAEVFTPQLPLNLSHPSLSSIQFSTVWSYDSDLHPFFKLPAIPMLSHLSDRPARQKVLLDQHTQHSHSTPSLVPGAVSRSAQVHTQLLLLQDARVQQKLEPTSWEHPYMHTLYFLSNPCLHNIYIYTPYKYIYTVYVCSYHLRVID